MKVIFQFILLLCFSTASLIAQEEETDVILKTKINIQLGDKTHSDTKPKLGLYLEDLDFEDAYERHYPECYGVLVSGLVTGGNADKAGLIEDDIIMEFDGEQVRFEDHLVNLRNTKKVGDQVQIKYFRNEKTYTTDLTFFHQSDDHSQTGYSSKTGKKKFSPGYGGGYPVMIKLDYDFAGITTLIAEYGFAPLSADNAVMFGGGGMGNIGKGWFIGGMGAGMLYSKSIPSVDSGNYSKSSLKIESGFGGVSLVKKHPVFTEKLVLDVGTTLGGGETVVEIAHTDGDYKWSSIGNNSYAKYSKGYMVLYPEIGIMVRIKKWLGVRASAGQLITYATNDSWTDTVFGMDVSGAAPDPINGSALSLAIWFGF